VSSKKAEESDRVFTAILREDLFGVIVLCPPESFGVTSGIRRLP
jgi:hypothetical protein